MHETLPWRTELLSENRDLLGRFERETACGTSRTASTYRRRIEAALRRHAITSGKEPLLREVVGDPHALAVLIANDISLRDGRRLSIATVRGSIDALRAFVAWLPISDPSERHVRRDALESALIENATVRGLRRFLSKFAPSTYYAAKRRPPSWRTVTDQELKRQIGQVHRDNFDAYGVEKIASTAPVRVFASPDATPDWAAGLPDGRWCTARSVT